MFELSLGDFYLGCHMLKIIYLSPRKLILAFGMKIVRIPRGVGLQCERVCLWCVFMYCIKKIPIKRYLFVVDNVMSLSAKMRGSGDPGGDDIGWLAAGDIPTYPF